VNKTIKVNKPIRFAEGKIERAEHLVQWLNRSDQTMTYAEFGAVIGHPRWAVGDLLGEINRRHKAHGGIEMITACVVTKAGKLSKGYQHCKEALALV
jgi:hypothetical protein